MSEELQVVGGQVPAREEFFGALTPAMVYQFLKKNARMRTNTPYVIPVDLPKSVELSGKLWHPCADGYFVQTRRTDSGELVDGGVVIDKKASPDVYVVTAFSPFGEYTKHPFVSRGNPGKRTIGNEKLGVLMDATLEDILDFGSTWTPEQKERVLKSAVNQHYQGLFPQREISLGSRLRKYLPK